MDNYNEFKKVATVRRNAAAILVAGGMNKEAGAGAQLSASIRALLGAIKDSFRYAKDTQRPVKNLLGWLRKDFGKYGPAIAKNPITVGVGAGAAGAGIGAVGAKALSNDKKASLDKRASVLRALLTILGGSAAAGGIGAGIGAIASKDKKRGAARGFGIGSGISLGGHLGTLGGGLLTRTLGGAAVGNLAGNVAGGFAGDAIAKNVVDKKASYSQFKKQAAPAGFAMPKGIGDALKPAPAPIKIYDPKQAVGNAQMDETAAAEGVSTNSTDPVSALTTSLDKITAVAKGMMPKEQAPVVDPVTAQVQPTPAQVAQQPNQTVPQRGAVKAASLYKESADKNVKDIAAEGAGIVGGIGTLIASMLNGGDLGRAAAEERAIDSSFRYTPLGIFSRTGKMLTPGAAQRRELRIKRLITNAKLHGQSRGAVIGGLVGIPLSLAAGYGTKKLTNKLLKNDK